MYPHYSLKSRSIPKLPTGRDYEYYFKIKKAHDQSWEDLKKLPRVANSFANKVIAKEALNRNLFVKFNQHTRTWYTVEQEEKKEKF